jgi:hypothetical protein
MLRLKELVIIVNLFLKENCLTKESLRLLLKEEKMLVL